MLISPTVSRGTVFKRGSPEGSDAPPHFWVVLTDPVCVDGMLQVVWVSLSSVKSWVRYPPGTYRFNVGKTNKYMDATKDSTAFMEYAEVVALKDIEGEAPARQGTLRVRDVDGICRQLKSSNDAPASVRAFYAKAVS